MAKADHALKFPKWLAVLLWVIVIIVAYVGTSWWWHQSDKYRLWPIFSEDEDPDPFVDPPWIQSTFITLCDSTLFDFREAYQELTNPLRLRKDPNGNPYFDYEGFPWSATSAHLRAMGEPSFTTRKDDDKSEYFRLTLIPAVHAVQSFRITITPKSKITLHVTQLDGQGLFYPGKVLNQKTFTLTQAEFKQLAGEIENPEFWKPLSELENRYHMGFGMDRAEWVFENSAASSYKAVRIINPFAQHQTPEDYESAIEDGEIRDTRIYAKIGTRLLEKYGFPEFEGEVLE